MYLGGILKTIIQLKGKHHLDLAEKEKLCKFPKISKLNKRKYYLFSNLISPTVVREKIQLVVGGLPVMIQPLTLVEFYLPKEREK